ncbi:MAG: hypothetical protein E7316_03640 [Clostridiales bacterium]|nr:hypothetical protein [Clostridiales bacterium]
MIRFLVFGDLHLEDCADGQERLETILRHAREEQVDFIVSLGDLCFPTEQFAHVMAMLNSCGIPVHHTIGNHDVQEWDIAHSLRFLGKERPYEAFEAGEYKFIILDTCYWKSEQGEYHFPNRNRVPSAYPVLPEEQLTWLEEQLSDGKKYIVFSHMSLVNPFAHRGIANKEAVQRLFAGKNVLLCMNGHDHGSDLKWINGVPYCTVSSASQFCWWGGNPPEVKNLFYRDPLHVIVEVDENEIRIHGMESEFAGLKPEDVGVTDYRWNGVDVHPRAQSHILSRHE